MRTSPRASASADELLHLGGAHRRRLLDEDVLARLERRSRERIVRRDGRRDHDGVDVVVGEHLVEVAGDPCVRVALGELRAPLLARVAEPAQVGEIVEVAREVAAPVAEPRLSDPQPRHSLKTCSAALPFAPVALRRSTTSGASSTSSLVVERGVVGDDDDAVVGARLVGDGGELEPLLVDAAGRAGRGTRRRRPRSAAAR